MASKAKRKRDTDPAPTFAEFQAMTFERRLATSFTEKGWIRYAKQQRREYCNALKGYFQPQRGRK